MALGKKPLDPPGLNGLRVEALKSLAAIPKGEEGKESPHFSVVHNFLRTICLCPW